MKKLREMAGVVLFLFAAGSALGEVHSGSETVKSVNWQETIADWWQGIVELLKGVVNDDIGRGMLIVNGIVAVILLLIMLLVSRSSRKQKKALMAAKDEVDEAMRQLAADRHAAVVEINQAIDRVHGKCGEAINKTASAVEEMKDGGSKSIEEMRRAINGVKAAWSKVQQWEKAGQERFDEIDKAAAAATKESVEEIEAKGSWERKLLKMWKYAINMTARKEHAKASEVLEEASALWDRIREEYPGTHEAFNNWGGVLLERAKAAAGDERDKLFDEAIDKLMVSESVRPGAGAYNLACVYAVMGNLEESRRWLEVGGEAGTLEGQTHAMADEDLRVFWHERWFMDLEWKQVR